MLQNILEQVAAIKLVGASAVWGRTAFSVYHFLFLNRRAIFMAFSTVESILGVFVKNITKSIEFGSYEIKTHHKSQHGLPQKLIRLDVSSGDSCELPKEC